MGGCVCADCILYGVGFQHGSPIVVVQVWSGIVETFGSVVGSFLWAQGDVFVCLQLAFHVVFC